MAQRPRREIDERKDLAVLTRIAATARQSIESLIGQFDTVTHRSIVRLYECGLLDGRTYVNEDYELIEQYTLNPNGRRVCSSALDRLRSTTQMSMRGEPI